MSSVMQTTQKGIILHSVTLLPPIARIAQNFGFRPIIDQVTIKGIRDYQKYVSPHKGFCCAYRKLHGTESCSEFLRQAVQVQGLVAAIPLFQERLAACKQAHLTLQAQAQAEEEEPEANQENQESQTPKKFASSKRFCENLPYCDCGASSIDFGACGGDGGFCDCGSFGAGETIAGCGNCGTFDACDIVSGCDGFGCDF